MGSKSEQQALVDVTRPTRTNISEVVVTGPGAPAIASADDLSGKEVSAGTGDKYYASLASPVQVRTARPIP